MSEVITETHSHIGPLSQLVYLIAGIISLLLGFRFVFLLLGLTGSQAINFIYTTSEIFVRPFYNLFGASLSYAGSRIELESLVAIVVTAIVASIMVAVLRLVNL